MNAAIKVLDHGFVRLVESMGTDLSISRAARVSYDAAWRAGEDSGSDARLIRYLLKNRHTTPFESVVFQFEVMAPIFVLRQWHRHRTWSFNELSARYRELPEKFYVPAPEMIGGQATDNKQARTFEHIEHADLAASLMAECNHNSFEYYKKLLDYGVSRELARSVLPVSTYSHMFAKVDLHNLLHFLNLRLHSHAQYEIRVYAEALIELIRPIVPETIAAWEDLRA